MEQMDSIQAGRRSRRGFALPELLVFILLLTGLSMVLLPVALQTRKSENEDHAVEYLRMMSASESLWKTEVGSYVELRRLAESVPNPAAGGFHLRTPPFNFTPKIIFDGTGIGHRAGYRYRTGHDQNGRITGCWAWPNLREYSGLRTFWVDFAEHTVYEAPIAASWEDTPGSLAPNSIGLVPVSGS